MTIKATLVYIERNNQILMIHRNKREKDLHLGKYNGLGGKLDPNETLEDCAKREVLEESGLVLLNLFKKGEILFPKFDKFGNDWEVHIYYSNEFSGDLIAENPEGTLVWIPKDKLLELNLWEGDKLFISRVFKDEEFRGTLYYQDGVLDSKQQQIIETIG